MAGGESRELRELRWGRGEKERKGKGREGEPGDEDGDGDNVGFLMLININSKSDSEFDRLITPPRSFINYPKNAHIYSSADITPPNTFLLPLSATSP